MFGGRKLRVMTNDELLSKTISYLRFPLTVGVVFIHFGLSKGLNIHGVKQGLENPDWYFFIIKLISETLARIGVPLFFIISGFLFFYRNDFSKDVYRKKLRTRFITLFVPFVLWNCVAIMWKLKCLLPGISSFYRPVEIEKWIDGLWLFWVSFGSLLRLFYHPRQKKTSMQWQYSK